MTLWANQIVDKIIAWVRTASAHAKPPEAQAACFKESKLSRCEHMNIEMIENTFTISKQRMHQ